MKHIAAAVCALLLSSTSALAHHTSSTSRLATNTGPVLAQSPSELGSPLFRSGFLYESNYFSQSKEGAARYEKSKLGRVWTQTLASQLSLTLPTRSYLGLTLPVGLLELKAPDTPTLRRAGLGDVSLYLAQELLPAHWETPWSMRAAIGLSAPTGAYEPEHRLSVHSIENAEYGYTSVSTYNAQASLGSGSFSGQLTLQTFFELGQRSQLSGQLRYEQPLSRTEDGILWGSDLEAQVKLQMKVTKERFSVSLGTSYRTHFPDHLPAAEHESHGSLAGRRDELALEAGLLYRSHRAHFCQLGVRLPYFQHVQGVQLVETVSGYLKCSFGFPL